MSIEQTPNINVSVVAFRILDGTLQVFLKNQQQGKTWVLPETSLHGAVSLESIVFDTVEKEIGYRNGSYYKEQLYTFDIPKKELHTTTTIEIAYIVLLPGDIVSDSDRKNSWLLYHKLPLLPPNHEKFIRYGCERLRGKLGYTNIAFGLLPREFTLTQLQNVYEIILGKTFDKRNFRKKMLALEILQSMGKKKRLGNNRPAEIYRFRSQELTYVDVL